MANQPERHETSPRSETMGSPSSQESRQVSQQPDVQRAVPSATEPGSQFPQRGLSGPLRSGALASPWEMMRSMSEEIDRLVEGLAGWRTAYTPLGLARPRHSRALADFDSFGSAWAPAVEVIQKPNAYVFRAELPGIKADAVQVHIEDGLLTIAGERKQEHKEDRDGYMRTERSYGSFHRAFPLPAGADENRISANFRDGILDITVPVASAERGRKIKIES
jgi:HSP20 family protein